MKDKFLSFWRSGKSIYYILFFLYAALSLFGLINHEPWADEAQAWLIARDNDFFGIWRQASYEGSPIIWQLLLHPLAKLGLPYFSEALLHWFIALGIVWLLLFKAPWSKFLKVSLLLSYLLLFEYVVIARNYSISIFILFLILTFYKERLLRPWRHAFLIFLLFATNIHSFGAAGALSLLFFLDLLKDNKWRLKKYLGSLALLFLGAVLTIWQVWPVPGQMNGIFAQFSIEPAFRALFSAFWPLGSSGLLDFNNFSFLLFTFFLFLPLALVFQKKEGGIFFFISLFWLFFVFTYKHSGAIRHHGLILFFFLGALWLNHIFNQDQKREVNYKINFESLALLILSGFLLVSSYSVFVNYRDDYYRPYSGAKTAAKFVKDKDFLEYEICAHPSHSTSALLPYWSKKKVFYAGREEYGTYNIWDRKFLEGNKISNAQALERCRKKLGEQAFIFLSTKDLELKEGEGVKLFSSQERVMKIGESYQIYLIN